MVHFDPTITLGTVVTIFVTVGTVGIAWVAFQARVNVLLISHRELIDALRTALKDHEALDQMRFTKNEEHVTGLVGVTNRLLGAIELGSKLHGAAAKQ